MRKQFLFIMLAVVVGMFCVSCGRDESIPSEEVDLTCKYEVIVTGFDPDWKIRGIKAVREATGLGLADALNLVENVPSKVASGLSLSQAEDTEAFLEASRLVVEVRPE